MRVFVYEFATGGGLLAQPGAAPPESLVTEGRAMVTALAADFAAIDGTAVDVLRDARQPPLSIAGVAVHDVRRAGDERRALADLSAAADWTVLIAPEIGDALLARVRAVERAGGRLLGPSSQVVALAGDKQATAEHLARQGVSVPYGMALAPGEPLAADFPYPAVLKPRDGAGSLGIRRIARRSSGAGADFPARLETFCPGMPASVAFLCGPQEQVALAPCRQHLDAESLAYRGGGLPLPPAWAARARRLAARAVAALPRTVGYLGVDLVLGNDPAGSGDVVVEINPRLTTSYVGLRALSRGNLAEAMVRVACGRTVELCWNEQAIEFTSAGEWAESPGST